MKKTLTDILNDFNTQSMNKIANDASAGTPIQIPEQQPVPMNMTAPAVGQPQVSQPVPVGSPEEMQAIADQEAAMQAEAAVNAANAEVAAQKAKEDAVINAAGALVAAEQQKQDAVNTLNQVAQGAIATENAAIAKEAADFGEIAGESMANSFYNTMYMNNKLNEIYSNGYNAIDSLFKSASAEEQLYAEHLTNAYNQVDTLLGYNLLQKHASDVYDATDGYIEEKLADILFDSAYNKVAELY